MKQAPFLSRPQTSTNSLPTIGRYIIIEFPSFLQQRVYRKGHSSRFCWIFDFSSKSSNLIRRVVDIPELCQRSDFQERSLFTGKEGLLQGCCRVTMNAQAGGENSS